MSFIRFDNTIKDSDLKREVALFIETIGFKNLDNRISKLDGHMRRNAFAQYLLAEKHQLEFSLWGSVKELRAYGRVPPYQELKNNRAYSFMFVFNRIYAAISELGRKRLLGRVLNGFDGENDLSSLDHELKAAGHFINLGGRIECHDLENGGFDFLCERSGVEFEIECKAISVDRGRQIHQHDLLSLSDYLNRDIISLVDQPDGFGTVVSVTIPSRLSREETSLKALAKEIETVFASGQEVSKDDWQIASQRFLISTSPFGVPRNINREATQDFVRTLFPRSTGQLLLSSKLGSRVVILDVNSAKSDKYIGKIYKSLKEGASQLSGTRPGVIIAAILDLSSQDLELIARDPRTNGFEAIATRLLENDSRDHLHTVMFTSDPGLKRKLDGSVSSSGISLNFKNPRHPLTDDVRLRFTL